MTFLLPMLRSDTPADPLDGFAPVVVPGEGGPRPAQGPRAVAWAALAVLLSYPDDALCAELDGVQRSWDSVSGDLPAAVRDPVSRLLVHVRTVAGARAEQDYVATFDTRRRCCLYLTYYLHGDTRRRGVALWRLKASLRACGVEPTGGELPDHLPVVLELAACGDEGVAVRLIEEHRKGLVLLEEALASLGSPYACGIEAVLALLPALDPAAARREAAAARELAAAGPPTETVGLPAWTAPFAPVSGAPR